MAKKKKKPMTVAEMAKKGGDARWNSMSQAEKDAFAKMGGQASANPESKAKAAETRRKNRKSRGGRW